MLERDGPPGKPLWSVPLKLQNTMQKIIKKVDEKRGIVQITIADERWYSKEITNEITGLPEIKFVPSSTWISGHYPKGIAFYKWLADHGWDEAEAIKSAAGDKGSKVHFAICSLIDGAEVKMDSKFKNPSTGQEEELTLEEYDCISSFADWFKEVKPEVLSREIVVWNDQYNYAGTVDLVCKINGETWVIDFKTGQYIWPEYELQISSYKHAIGQEYKLGVLQLGYKRNSKHYKFTEVKDKFDLFLSARQIWANENEGVEPKKRDYPLSLSLNINGKQQSDSQASGDSAPAPVATKKRKGSANGNGTAPSENNRGQAV